jgi:hypothetical protein
MVAVSLLALAFCAGGARDMLTGLIWVAVICGLPLIGLIGLFDSLDRRFGPYARYPIASIGLIPLLLVIHSAGRGNASYMTMIVVAGLAWSAAWLATSYTFSGGAHSGGARSAVSVPPPLPPASSGA